MEHSWTRKNLVAFACLILLSLSVDAQSDRSAPPSTPSSTTVLAAIDRMLGASTVSEAESQMRIVLDFAMAENVPVAIMVNPDLIPVDSGDESEIDVYYLVFYYAGAIKFDLGHPAEAYDPMPDMLAGVRAMITGMQIVKKERPDYEQPLLEDLAKIDESGGLENHVAKSFE